MEFQDSFIPTGIGSFPHTDEKEVFSVILENFSEIPFWPQLPNRSFKEGMVAQYSEGFPSLQMDDQEQRVWVDTSQGFDREVEKFCRRVENGELEAYEITEDHARGLRILKDPALDKHRNQMKYIKGQIAGPITFGLSLTDQERRPIFYEPTLREILVQHLSFKAQWMERRFNAAFPEVKTILFFDEPALSSLGSAFSGLNQEEVIFSLNQCLRAAKGLKGIHCCGNTDWGLLLSADLDILSFDAFGYLETLSLYPKELGAFLERGGVLAWGIIPTSEDILREDAQMLVDRVKKGMRELSSKGIDPILLKRAIITPSCGTASLPIALAERVCHVTAEVSRRLKESP